MLNNKLSFIFSLSLIWCCFIQASYGAPEFALDQKPVLATGLDIKSEKLCSVADNTLRYMNQHSTDKYAVHDGKASGMTFPVQRVKQTLEFICAVQQQDRLAGVTSRLNDEAFLKKHFEFFRWYPDKEKASSVALKSTNDVKARMLNNIPEEQLFLTKYYTKLIEGSEVPTSLYTQALYALPEDEKGLTQEQAYKIKGDLIRFRYTRQDVINGALKDEKLAKPLVWITEEALHDVLLQGTGVLKVNGKTRYFNVHRNNNIDYDYHIGKREQARYWYFAEVPGILGYGKEIDQKISIEPYVSIAGNVKQLGLGKLFLISYESNESTVSHLAILADEGGAFDNNLFQLDFLVGSYYGWSDYHQANKHLPDYASVWILLLKGTKNDTN
jgi:MltA specific insert domain